MALNLFRTSAMVLTVATVCVPSQFTAPVDKLADPFGIVDPL